MLTMSIALCFQRPTEGATWWRSPSSRPMVVRCGDERGDESFESVAEVMLTLRFAVKEPGRLEINMLGAPFVSAASSRRWTEVGRSQCALTGRGLEALGLQSGRQKLVVIGRQPLMRVARPAK
ncbi:hypothetical protein ACFVFJ_33800 [Streptomyces sp. NPDC057717]|uniref:hypothetical protein n=1 Tax=Streptomyces sp. NPDC057717 TaxID=3346224 RepID=UPI00369CA262